MIDQQFVNQAFVQNDGVKRLNSLLGGNLDNVLNILRKNIRKAMG
ncbi:MAG: hypothetical protein ACXW0H_10550 [Methylobacter sp.]